MKIIKRKMPRIVYSSEYNYGLSSVGNYAAFDIKKYKRIYEKLLENKLLKKRDVLRPQMCSDEDLKLFHTEEYLHDIRNPQYVNDVLRIDTNDLIYNSVLEYYRSVTGGTLLATAYALKWNVPVFNLGGGFHHAHPDKAEGFCLLNDVAIAIEKFRYLHRAKRFIIIDLDYHQGNGNLLYFKDDLNIYTFSMHADAWVEIDRPQNKDILLPQGCDDETYLSILEQELSDSCMNFQPDAVFYVAGSDPYEKDTLTDMDLTREGLLKRNLYVYDKVTDKKIPLIIVAGGGYGTDSWEIYYDFIAHSLGH
jgi:acetoin utilization deacetylase AcuC-like enzyme